VFVASIRLILHFLFLRLFAPRSSSGGLEMHLWTDIG
jgi:hypothetical protein